MVASVHESHAYADGACLYFTFAGRGPTPPARATATTTPSGRLARAPTTAGRGTPSRRVLAHGGAISHHHGIGLNRGRFMAEPSARPSPCSSAMKEALDPHGILNPGKLGLASPFGAVPWP